MKRLQIERRVTFWQRKLGLDNWNIEVFFDLKKRASSSSRNFITAAHTDANPKYKIGSISFNPKALAAVDDEVIIHELLHCLTAFLVGSACKRCGENMKFYNETMTAELSRIILRLNK